MIKMKTDFKRLTAGMVVDPDPEMAAWLVSRNYAEYVADEPAMETASPASPAPQPVKRARKAQG